MPRVKRKSKLRSNVHLNFYELMALSIGWRDPVDYPFIPTSQLGYLTYKELKEAWARHKSDPRLITWDDPHNPNYLPGRRPWAWWEFEATEKRDRTIPHHEQLERLGVLLESEKAALARRDSRRVNPDFSAYVDGLEFLPLPELEPYKEEVQSLIDTASEVADDRYRWVMDRGSLTPADADAILNHGCYLDLDRGFHAVDFVETFCRASQGVWAGEPMELTEWQVRWLVSLFGWLRPDGTRRFREAALWIAKKNGKSTLCAALNIYLAVADGEGGPKIFNAAVTRQQTAEVFGECANMIEYSPELSRILKIKDSVKEIALSADYRVGVDSKRDVFLIKALAAEAGSAEGKNSHATIKDELHVWENRKLLSALKFAGAARRQPLNISISTAGDSLESIGGEKYEYSKKIVEGEIFNFAFFGTVYEASQGLDYSDPRVHLNPEIWRMANPSLGITIGYEFILESIQANIDNPSDWADVLRYHFNVWIGTGQPYLPMQKWAECGLLPIDYELQKEKRSTYGLDLAAVEDTTAGCLLVEEDKDRYSALWRCWVPLEVAEEKARAKKSADGRYLKWIEDGHMTATEGARVDQEHILEQVLRDYQEYRFEQLAIDIHNAEWIRQALEGHGIDVVAFSPTYKNYTSATRALKDLIKDGRFAHGNNPVVNWQAGSLTVIEGDFGCRPVKLYRKKRYKIDLMVAAIMALSRMIAVQESGSRYDDDDAEVLVV